MDPSEYNDKVTQKPQYNFEAFKAACAKGSSEVFVWDPAREDAKKFFSLSPESELLKFVAEDGLENLTHQNTKNLENELYAGSKYHPVVDAYLFQTGSSQNKKTGYIAFFWNVLSKLWVIKSFKVSDKQLKASTSVKRKVEIKFRS